ncbi:class I SAM-dependent methyltransferase [Lentzea terrae]|uniref:class I SAM-dependent methyltransferase n=1 Tax=Lentzea terrae TaxID=2200761 RepID=UPI000DD4102B|nr:class I SAM-dependent methyltransferase [Lentzea terrae]
MTELDIQTTTTHSAEPGVRGGWRTPDRLYRMISSPVLRMILGWDLPRYDLRVISRRPGTICLEVGSGGGFYTAALKTHLGNENTLIALDPSPSAMQSLERRLDGLPGAQMSYVAGDGCKLPLANDQADTLFYGYSLEEMPDPLSAIHEAHRVLRPGGELVLFLWRPVFTRHRRRPVIALLDELFERRHTAAGPQNIRLIYRKLTE